MSLLAAYGMPQAIEGSEALKPLESLVIQEGGRKKPFLTFAQEELLLIHGRTSYRDVASGKRWDAMSAVVDMWVNPQQWAAAPIVLVDYRPLKEIVGLEVQRRHFSLAELQAETKLWEFAREANELRRRDRNAKVTSVQQKALDTAKKVEALNGILSGEVFRVVPHPQAASATWGTLDQLPELHGERASAAINAARDFLASAQTGEPDAAAAASFVRELRALAPNFFPSEKIIGVELSYVHWHPFRIAWIVLLGGLVAMGAAALFKSGAGFFWGVITSVLALGFLTWGMLARVMISGRAPVTNMYESVVWLALGILVFALAFELRSRARLYFWGSFPIAILALMMADSAPTVVSPSLEPLVAVLRSNFWLTVHVMTIVTSYSVFAVAMGVGHILLWKYARGRTEEMGRLGKLLTTALHLGTWMLGTGIVLGAVWANYSWGRFWDWDPKETFSLVAFLGYLIVLHGRLFGFWKNVGLAAGSVLGFLLVLYAWYGVNYILAAGLHSYGFGSGNHAWFYLLIAAEMLYVIVTLLLGSRRGNVSSKLASAV